MLGRIPTALSNSHASVAHPRDGRRARLAGSSDPGGVTSKRRLRPSSSPKASLVDINNLQGVKPSNLTSDTPLGSRPKRGQHFVGPDSRRGTVNRLIYATKKSAISLPLHLLFSSRGYTICLPFQKTAAMNSCQLLNALTLRVIRQICKFFNPSVTFDHLTLIPTQDSSITLWPGPHAGSTGLARTPPKPLSSTQVLGFFSTLAGPRNSLAAQHTAAASTGCYSSLHSPA